MGLCSFCPECFEADNRGICAEDQEWIELGSFTWLSLRSLSIWMHSVREVGIPCVSCFQVRSDLHPTSTVYRRGQTLKNTVPSHFPFKHHVDDYAIFACEWDHCGHLFYLLRMIILVLQAHNWTQDSRLLVMSLLLAASLPQALLWFIQDRVQYRLMWRVWWSRLLYEGQLC